MVPPGQVFASLTGVLDAGSTNDLRCLNGLTGVLDLRLLTALAGAAANNGALGPLILWADVGEILFLQELRAVMG